MSYTAFEIWTIIALIGIGTYLIRFSFLGLLGGTELPDWALRFLRYTPVAVIPGLIAPAVIWPAANGGETEPVRILAAAAALLAGCWLKSTLWAVVAGGGFFALGSALLG